jgi:Arc/MetJ-type ribon-helix-helix transcriptional regulator
MEVEGSAVAKVGKAVGKKEMTSRSQVVRQSVKQLLFYTVINVTGS